MDETLTKYKKKQLQEAAKIVKSGWSPHFFMIDKSRAERSAIRKGILLRLSFQYLLNKSFSFSQCSNSYLSVSCDAGYFALGQRSW